MKKSIKVALLAIAMLLAINISAQKCPMTYGVKAGMNLSNFSGDIEGNDARVGFQFGVTAECPLAESFFIQSGLEFTVKGAKSDYRVLDGSTFINVEERANPMYLQMPIHGAYKLKIAENTKIVFNAGPYIAYGIGGKTKHEESLDNVTVITENNFFGSNANRRFDFGVGAGGGIEIGKISLNTGIDFGLTNIARNGNKLRNQNAYLTLGYRF